MRRLCVLGLLLLGCEKSLPDLGAKPSPSATEAQATAPSSHVPNDDDQPPVVLCTRMNLLHNKEKTQITPIDPKLCLQKFREFRTAHADLWPCLSLCVIRADDFTTASQCSGICAPAEQTCKDAGGKKDACIARFKKVQADLGTTTFACVSRCGNKHDDVPSVVDCMGNECGL